MQMLRNIPLVINNLLLIKNKKVQGQTQPKVTKTMPCVYFNDSACSHQKYHKTSGVYYKHICGTCFAHKGKSSAHSALECRQKIKKKRVGLSMVSGYRGPTQNMGVSSVGHSGGYDSGTSHSKHAAVSQYDAPPHVSKTWLMMSNMRKSVDPSHSFADVLKEGPSKQQKVCPPLSKSSTSKIQTASKTQVPLKVQVPEISRLWSPCEQGKSTYVQKLVDPSPYQVPCHNRFAPLSQLEKIVVSTHQDSDQSVLQTGHKVKSKVKSTNGKRSQVDGVYKCLNQQSKLLSCHGRFQSLKPGYVQDIGKSHSQLSPVVIESNDSSNNF